MPSVNYFGLVPKFVVTWYTPTDPNQDNQQHSVNIFGKDKLQSFVDVLTDNAFSSITIESVPMFPAQTTDDELKLGEVNNG